jgi:hypothetical protein
MRPAVRFSSPSPVRRPGCVRPVPAAASSFSPSGPFCRFSLDSGGRFRLPSLPARDAGRYRQHAARVTSTDTGFLYLRFMYFVPVNASMVRRALFVPGLRRKLRRLKTAGRGGPSSLPAEPPPRDIFPRHTAHVSASKGPPLPLLRRRPLSDGAGRCPCLAAVRAEAHLSISRCRPPYLSGSRPLEQASPTQHPTRAHSSAMTASRGDHACSFAFPPSAHISPTTSSASPSDTTPSDTFPVHFARAASDVCQVSAGASSALSLCAPALQSLTDLACLLYKQTGWTTGCRIHQSRLLQSRLACRFYPVASIATGLSSNIYRYRATCCIAFQASVIHKPPNGPSHHHSDHSAGLPCPVRSFR